MTLKVIPRLYAFSSAIRRTFVPYFTRSQPTARSRGPSATARLLVFISAVALLCLTIVVRSSSSAQNVVNVRLSISAPLGNFLIVCGGGRGGQCTRKFYEALRGGRMHKHDALMGVLEFSWVISNLRKRPMGNIGCLGKFLLKWGWGMCRKIAEDTCGDLIGTQDAPVGVVKFSWVIRNVGNCRSAIWACSLEQHPPKMGVDNVHKNYKEHFAGTVSTRMMLQWEW